MVFGVYFTFQLTKKIYFLKIMYITSKGKLYRYKNPSLIFQMVEDKPELMAELKPAPSF